MNKKTLELMKKNQALDAYYADRVNEKIRARYSLSEELSLLRRREEAGDAFACYTAFAERAKAEARAEIEEVLP